MKSKIFHSNQCATHAHREQWMAKEPMLCLSFSLFYLLRSFLPLHTPFQAQAHWECKHIKVAQAKGGQILPYQISVFPVDVDKLSKYGQACVMVYCLCTAAFINGLYVLFTEFSHCV